MEPPLAVFPDVTGPLRVVQPLRFLKHTFVEFPASLCIAVCSDSKRFSPVSSVCSLTPNLPSDLRIEAEDLLRSLPELDLVSTD